MNDESNALRQYTPFDIWFRYQNSAQQNEPLFCDYKAALAQIESLTREKATYKDKFGIAIAVLEGKCKPMAPIGDSHDPELARGLEERYQAALIVRAQQQEAIAYYDTLRAELDAAKVEIEYLVTRISYGHEPRQNPVRDEAICALNSLGMTPTRIGIAFDVSRQRVHQIIDTARSRGETGEKIG